ncbi:hypothetical protein F5Y16DRAFT_397629 [Xylariaceae sp. FL0255]|nr:hypothetical protein F5Y16DRAFT_397629 [Xylariaceae sp. FL0255]
MESASFHRFSDLPKELRLQIWEECISSFSPAAQFFTMAEVHAIDPHYYMITPCRFGCSLAAPICRHTGVQSWRNHNLSAYMIDQGLWTACHESRMVMLKHHSRRIQPDFKEKEIASYRNWEELWTTPLPTTMTAGFSEGGSQQCFSFDPTNDLICIQPVGWMPMYHSSSQEMADSIPFLLPMEGFDARNVALEYRAAWTWGEREILKWQLKIDDDSFYMLKSMNQTVNDYFSHPKLWFIDYRLRLRQNSKENPFEDGRMLFKGLGCTFIEMHDTDDCWEASDASEKSWEDMACFNHSIFYFIDTLSEKLRFWLEIDSMCEACEEPTPIRVEMGGLACVFDNGSSAMNT